MQLSQEKPENLSFQAVLDLKFHKKPMIWFFSLKINEEKLKISEINVKEKRINMKKVIEDFSKSEDFDFQEGCDMTDYLSLCVCLEKDFIIFDLDFYESGHLFLDKLQRKTEILPLKYLEDDSKYPKVAGIYHESSEYFLEKLISELPDPIDYSLIRIKNTSF